MKNFKKRKFLVELIFVTLVFVLISLPLNGIFFKSNEYLEFEKRKPIEFSYVIERGLFNKEFFRNFEIWFEDNFFLRKQIIKAHSKISRNLFGEAPSDNVIIGNDGWLFYKSDEAFECFVNSNLLTESEIINYKNKVENFIEFCQIQNKDFYFMVIPNKSTVYSEFMPSSIVKLNQKSRLEQISEVLPGSNFLNTTEFLLQNKNAELLFYKNDTHWNNLGAFIGFYKFIDKFFPELKKQYSNLDLKSILKEEIEIFRKGDLDLMMGIDKEQKTIDYKINFINNEYTITKINEKKHFYTVSKANNELKVLIYRDSFFEPLVPLFSSFFNKVEYKWSFDIDKDYILSNDFDFIIVESVERYIDDINW